MTAERTPDLFQGLTAREIKDNLQGMAHKVEERSYLRPLSPEDIATRKDALVEQSVKLNLLDRRKKAAVAEFSGEMKSLGLSNKILLNEITSEAVEEDGEVFHILSDDNLLVNEYSAAGRWLRARKPKPEEKQRHIAMRVADAS